MDHSYKDWAAEDYRPTAVHNPPEYFPQPAPQKAGAESDEITVGRLLFHLLLLGLTVLTTTFAVGFSCSAALLKARLFFRSAFHPRGA